MMGDDDFFCCSTQGCNSPSLCIKEKNEDVNEFHKLKNDINNTTNGISSKILDSMNSEISEGAREIQEPTFSIQNSTSTLPNDAEVEGTTTSEVETTDDIGTF